MGLFSTKKRIYVSSTVYNLAGDVNDRVDFLKTTVVGATMSKTKRSLSESLTKSYLEGPGMKLRAFGRWARRSGYNDLVGMPADSIGLAARIDQSALAAVIPHAAGQSVLLQAATIGAPDFTYWVDRWLLANMPSVIDTAYTVDFAEATQTVTIHLENGEVHSFVAEDFDSSKMYLYATYNLTSEEETQPLVPGSEVSLGSGGSFPSTSGWTQNSYTSSTGSMALVTTTDVLVTYSDNRPSESSTSSSTTSQSYLNFEGEWERTDYQGLDSAQAVTWSKRQVMHQKQVASKTSSSSVTTTTTTISGGVVKTTKTTTTTESLSYARTYQIDEQRIIHKTWGGTQVLIYARNTGNPAYDAFFQLDPGKGAFLPYVPIRLDNKFISGSFKPELYSPSVKAVKRSMGASYANLQEKVQANPSIGDIDYAYIVYGVSLNVKENACRRYLYEFFQEIMLGQDMTGQGYLSWKAAWALARSQQAVWKTWWDAQFDENNPLFQTPEPPQPVFSDPPGYGIRTASTGRADINYDITVSWSGMKETTGAGIRDAAHKVGELWFEIGETEEFERDFIVTGQEQDGGTFTGIQTSSAYSMTRVRLYWQVDSISWKALDIYGLAHRNLIYGGKAVDITAAEALTDDDESGFIVPIHEDIYRRMPLVEATQMSTACCFLVFNCYQVVKQKWYQSGWFKIFLIVAIIVISIYTGGAGAGGLGLLGSNVAVGTAIGLTGTAAIIAGAVANALASMLLSTMIQTASTAIFGEKVGAIVGTIIAIIAVQVGTAVANDTSIVSQFAELMKAENILKLTNSATEAYSQYMQAGLKEMASKTQSLLEQYEAQSKEISEQYEKLGLGTNGINLLSLTSQASPAIAETPDSFLSRTLMTGDDVAELSMSMLTNFAEITLRTDLPT